MRTYRRRCMLTLIVALLTATLLSALSTQVYADTSPLIPHVADAMRRDNNLNLSQSFDCAFLTLSNKRLFGNQFRIDIHNDNPSPTVVSRIQITWPNIPSFAQMGLFQMSLNTDVIWTGNDPQLLSGTTTTTDTNTKQGNPPFSSTSTVIRTVAAQAATVYAASFSLPSLLTSYVTYHQYAITITMDNPSNPAAPCVLTSPVTTPTATPIFVGQPTSTPTPTPDCVSSLITVRFFYFDNFGIVIFNITNQRTTFSTLQGFNINWHKYVNSQRLAKVSLDASPGLPGAILVWDSGDLNQDASPSTNSQTEGTWLTNYTLPPGGTASIYFDFAGINRYDDYTASTDPRYGGASDFNGSEFQLTCDTDAGNQPIIQVTPDVIPTPTLFPTQTPTRTPTSVHNAAPKRNFYTTHTPTLTWNRVTWATKYELQISTDINFAPAAILTAFADTTLTYTTGNLPNGTYYWRVKAHNGTYTGNWSLTDTFVISASP